MEQNNSPVESLNGLNSDTLRPSSVKERPFKEKEVLRLIGQYLCDHGLESTYKQLSKDSGVSLEPFDATELRHAVLDGRWDEAEGALDRLVPMIADQNSVEEVRFSILEQSFLEYLENEDLMAAVTLLRYRITPMQRNIDRVHTLASCLMCRTPAELSAQAGGWLGQASGSRLQLIDRIQAFVPAQTMLPPRRLEELVDEAVSLQVANCLFHNPCICTSTVDCTTDKASISLLQRHYCGMTDFPSYPIQSEMREGELWLCQFSPNGLFLAVGGKEADVELWQVDPTRHSITFTRTFSTPAYTAAMTWSPDSKKLALCCGEEQSCVLVFDTTSGQQLCNHKINEDDSYCALAFFADCRKIAFGGVKGTFYVFDTENQGRLLTAVEGYRVQSMVALLPPPPSSSSTAVIANGNNSALSAPGGPPDNAAVVANTVTSNAGVNIDQLIIADSLHRVRLFRFGPLTTNQQQAATESTTSTAGGTAASSQVSSTMAVYVSGGGGSAPPSQQITSTGSTASLLAPGAPLGGDPSSGVGGEFHVPSIMLNVPILPVGGGSQQHNRLAQQQLDAMTAAQQSLMLSGGASSVAATPPRSAMQRPAATHQQQTSYSTVAPTNTGSQSGGGSLTILFESPSTMSHATSATGSYSTGLAPGGSISSESSSSQTGSVRALSAATAAALLRSAAVAQQQQQTVSPLNMTASTYLPTASRGMAALSLSSSALSQQQQQIQSATSTPSSAPPNLPPPLVSSTISSSPSTAGGVAIQSPYYGLIDHRTLFRETHPIQSIVLSRDSKSILTVVHKMDAKTELMDGAYGVHRWDIETGSILQRFIGSRQDTSKISATFGGLLDQFVASGSENGQLHVWHTSCGKNEPIFSASPSQPTTRFPLTGIHWNPIIPTMLATVSDSGELCVWGPQRYMHNSAEVQPMEASSS